MVGLIKTLQEQQQFRQNGSIAKDCAEKLGIDYNAQTPRSSRTPEEEKKINERLQKARSALIKTRQN